MLILDVLLDIKSKQGGVTTAFVHANVPEGENIYVEIPRGFKCRNTVLKPKKTLYGRRQSPCAFWKYLTEKLEASGLKQSELDPCIFVGDKVICIVYVDDLLFWSKDEEAITQAVLKLCELGVDLEQEDDAAGFLGVTLKRHDESGLLKMRQDGLIDRLIEALGLEDGYVEGKSNRDNTASLVKVEDEVNAAGQFSCSSVVGI